MLSIIVAKSKNNVIGRENKLPWNLPADLKHFKEITTGHKVIMGRKTFESITKMLGHPLPNRTNIIVTRNLDYKYKNCIVVHSLENALKYMDKKEEAFVIGGSELFHQALKLVNKVYITLINAELNGDAFFPDLDETFKLKSKECHKSDLKNCFDYSFLIYERNKLDD